MSRGAIDCFEAGVTDAASYHSDRSRPAYARFWNAGHESPATMNVEVAASEPRAVPRIEYVRLLPEALAAPLPPDVLAAMAFGRGEPHSPEPHPRLPGPPRRPADPRLIRVGLEPLGPADVVELWRAAGTVRTGSVGPVRFAADEEHLAGQLELDEREYGGLAAAAQWAYARILRFQASSPFPHLLRMWNYFDSINDGEGDAQRYKQFCIGRAQAFGAAAGRPLQRPAGLAGERAIASPNRFPAATAIGRRDGSPVLQMYWLAARVPGTALENPRQMSAYRYPREYGPASPSFSRAMLVPGGLLLVSGTASIVGHASRHRGSLRDQLDETLANLATVLERAAAIEPALPPELSPRTRLKIYLRDGAAAKLAAAHLAQCLPPGAQCLMLEADICRDELLVEVDCIHA
ncbi:MAG: pteridine-dependent deoxygenase [Steroidobacteraceae bacterium]